MTDAVEMISQTLSSDMETLRMLALNVANTQTPGYKRIIPVAHAYVDSMDAARGHLAGAIDAPRVHGVTDVSAGMLRATGRSTDVALEGDAYFVVDGQNGTVLQRRGDFVVDALGYLATAAGGHVQGTRGALLVGDRSLEITPTGEVWSDGNLIDRLQLIQVDRPGDLRELGNGQWAVPGDGAVEAVGVVVRQGFLESSNVQSVNEMVRVMETLRHFEAAQRYFQSTDGLLQKAISELGKVGN